LGFVSDKVTIMKPYCSRFLLSCLLCILSQATSALPVFPQETKLDEVARKLAEQIKAAKIKSVVVADFTTSDGAASPQGKLLATQLSDYWVSHEESFSVVDKGRFSDMQTKQSLTAKDMDTLEVLQRIGSALNVDALVTGTLAPSSNQFVLNIFVRTVQDARLQASASESFPQSVYSDSATKIHRAGLNGVGVPVCIYCPPPDYSDEARIAKLQGAVVLGVVISPEGTVAARIILVKGLGKGLDEKAIEAVKSWRFKPARDSAGNPVAVQIPIEVTFRFRK
jgi:TonB family protein